MIKVLIVEDDPMVAELNKRFVERVPEFTVAAVVNDGEKALSYLKTIKIDLVILDVYIPKLNGMEVLMEIRKLNIMVDVILVTAAKETDKIDDALKLGAVDYLIKPFEYERLKKSLENYLVRCKVLNNNNIIAQEDIDYITMSINKQKEIGLPKGIHKMTLNRIVQYLEKNKNRLVSSEEISEQLRMSKVTIRRYLDYLEYLGDVKLGIEYGTRGRPSYKYMYVK